MRQVAVVVPTNRPERLAEFRDAWGGATWSDIVVVYDGARRECALEWPGATIYCWDDYDARWNRDGWIFSRRDSACRSFGLLEAVRRGAEYVISLDDDCYPATAGVAAALADRHVRNLERPPRWVSSVPGLRVRGMPYDDNLPGGCPPALISMGLWCDVPDLSAVETLALWSALGVGRGEILRGFQPAGGTRVASPHQFFPFCGMNFAFRRAALPVLYFPRMGDGSPYARFDDIWCGLLLQRICAVTGDLITIGEPWVRHARASDVFANLVKEAPGIAAHERYWRTIAHLPIEGTTLTSCALSAADGLEAQEDAFLREWGCALRVWVSLCARALAGSP